MKGFAATISKNVVASLARVAVVSLVALILPAYLTHRLPVAIYAAWILILQLGAYVSYLDLGIQVGISKFVAEYEARGDELAAGQHASAGLALMLVVATTGVILTCVLAWQVPRLFKAMPAGLYHDVRISIILVGGSLAVGLVCSVYAAVFTGLQRYWIPVSISVANRASYAAIVILVVFLEGSLSEMAAAVAAVNLVSGAAQALIWRLKAARVRVSIALLDWGVLRAVIRYCSLQSISTIAMLCITGLDVVIVGHYDYAQTAYYSIATLPATFALSVIGALMGPILPASSAMSTQRSPAEMGDFTVKLTRYVAIVLLLTGLPLIVCGLPILRAWVGPAYAGHTFLYLRVLVLANIIRNLCLPYATVVTATGRQGAATASAICEGLVNLLSSIYLARNFGAIGVALGTLLGSLVSVVLHFAVSMRFTQGAIRMSRMQLLFQGFLRPACIGLPSLALISRWWPQTYVMAEPRFLVLWMCTTVMLAFYFGLNTRERMAAIQLLQDGLGSSFIFKRSG